MVRRVVMVALSVLAVLAMAMPVGAVAADSGALPVIDTTAAGQPAVRLTVLGGPGQAPQVDLWGVRAWEVPLSAGQPTDSTVQVFAGPRDVLLESAVPSEVIRLYHAKVQVTVRVVGPDGQREPLRPGPGDLTSVDVAAVWRLPAGQPVEIRVTSPGLGDAVPQAVSAVRFAVVGWSGSDVDGSGASSGAPDLSNRVFPSQDVVPLVPMSPVLEKCDDAHARLERIELLLSELSESEWLSPSQRETERQILLHRAQDVAAEVAQFCPEEVR